MGLYSGGLIIGRIFACEIFFSGEEGGGGGGGGLFPGGLFWAGAFYRICTVVNGMWSGAQNMTIFHVDGYIVQWYSVATVTANVMGLNPAVATMVYLSFGDLFAYLLTLFRKVLIRAKPARAKIQQFEFYMQFAVHSKQSWPPCSTLRRGMNRCF